MPEMTTDDLVAAIRRTQDAFSDPRFRFGFAFTAGHDGCGGHGFRIVTQGGTGMALTGELMSRIGYSTPIYLHGRNLGFFDEPEIDEHGVVGRLTLNVTLNRAMLERQDNAMLPARLSPADMTNNAIICLMSRRPEGWPP